MRRAVTGHLVGMLALTTLVFGVGAVQKAACANEAWVERREGPGFQCYSDVADLRRTEQLLGGRLPYLEPCAPSAPAGSCDEYPVLTMYLMRASAWVAGTGGDPYTRFYWVNAAVLLVCALVTTRQLERLGAATALFAGAPILAVHGTTNWDLVPVALTAVATARFLTGRATAAGAWLGVGAAAKVYPGIASVAFALDRLRSGRRADAARLLVASAIAWLALNLPFALAAPEGWSVFFRSNATRPAEYDTLWRVACELGACAPTGVVVLGSVVLTVAGTWWAWTVRLRHAPSTPGWTIAFPLLVLFVLTSKVWSPQYGLWLLPLFALLAPSFRPWLAWQTGEVLVYLARFAFFEELAAGTASYASFGIAVVLRAGALAWCLVAWARATADRRGPVLSVR